MTRKAKTTPTKKRKNKAAATLGRLGGLARKRNLSPARASEIGRQAARARHAKASPSDSLTPEPTQ